LLLPPGKYTTLGARASVLAMSRAAYTASEWSSGECPAVHARRSPSSPPLRRHEASDGVNGKNSRDRSPSSATHISVEWRGEASGGRQAK